MFKKNRRKIKTAPSLGLGLILIHRWWPANHLILLEEVLVCDSAMRVNNRCKKAGCLGLCTATAVCVCAHGCMCVCACVCECSCVSLLVGCFFPYKSNLPHAQARQWADATIVNDDAKGHNKELINTELLLGCGLAEREGRGGKGRRERGKRGVS